MSDTIRISELFLSTQGEGLRTGVRSLFCRVFLCNLKCPGFSLKPGETNVEIPAIIAKKDQYKHYYDLPLSKTGCDSYPSSWGEFKEFSPEYTFEALRDKFVEIAGDMIGKTDLVITGGEPLLKPTQKKLVAFFEANRDLINSFQSITFETNGTQEITEEMKTWLSLRCKIPVIFSVSPKLACSGEPEKRRVVPNAIESIKQTVAQIKVDNQYVNKRPVLGVSDAVMYLKYVVSNEQDVHEAFDNANTLGFIQSVDGEIYLMPVGGTFEEYMANQRVVAELAIKYGCIFCCRVHQVTWRNCWSK